MSDGIYLMEEVQEKKVLLTLSLYNTVALDELRDQYPGKTQGELLNELINIGIKI